MRAFFLILAGGLFAIGAGEATAQEVANVPSYDIEAYCEQVSQAVGGSYAIRNGCIEQEKAARAAVQKLTIEERIRDYCGEVAQVVGGSYQIYQGCVDQEIKARDGKDGAS